jgi:hypothetical protein
MQSFNLHFIYLTLGYLSVVVIPIAADKMESFCIFLAARGTPSPVMAATGNLHPIIPLGVISRFNGIDCVTKRYLRMRTWSNSL